MPRPVSWLELIGGGVDFAARRLVSPWGRGDWGQRTKVEGGVGKVEGTRRGEHVFGLGDAGTRAG